MQLRKKSKWSSEEEDKETATETTTKKQKVKNEDDADDLEGWELEELQVLTHTGHAGLF